VPYREQDYLRPDEVPRYLEACSPFWRPRAMTLVLTGCRIGDGEHDEGQDGGSQDFCGEGDVERNRAGNLRPVLGFKRLFV
jgi:hypothetical protein